MDSCLTVECIKIPRPQIYSYLELAIIDRETQVFSFCNWCCDTVTGAVQSLICIVQKYFTKFVYFISSKFQNMRTSEHFILRI